MTTYAVALRRAWERQSNEPFNLTRAISDLADGREIELRGESRLPSGRPARIALVEASALGRRKLRAALGNRVWIEREIQHYAQAPAATFGIGDNIQIQVFDAQGSPLVHCLVTLFVTLLDSQTEQEIPRETDDQGTVEFTVAQPILVRKVVAAPLSGYWMTVAPAAPERMVCPEIDFPRDGIDWWHRALGFDSVDEGQGQGMRIGIVDTGCGDHPALEHVDEIGTFGGNTFDPEPFSASSHGGHVCGIIAARPNLPGGFCGLAPGAEVVMACISSNVMQFDIANAIRSLVEDRQVDLINISLTAANKSNILNDEILRADEAGSLCVCAAGNREGSVMWPARYSKAIAVSAIGRVREMLPGTLAASCLAHAEDARHLEPGFALASFSCSGREIDCCGPGVGIVSTLPSLHCRDGWRDWSGTSMASPAVCATLAARLGKLPQFLQLPRNSGRVRFMRRALRSMCQSVDLPETKQGWGIPCLSGPKPRKGKSPVGQQSVGNR